MKKISYIPLTCMKRSLPYWHEMIHSHLVKNGQLERVSNADVWIQSFRYSPGGDPKFTQLYSVWEGKPKSELKIRYYLLIQGNTASWIIVEKSSLTVSVMYQDFDSIEVPYTMTRHPRVLEVVKQARDKFDELTALGVLPPDFDPSLPPAHR